MTKTKTVRIACDVRDSVPLDDLHALQGELKSLSKEDYAKLRAEILDTGFAFPICVWKGPKGKIMIVGGHQRARALKEMRDAEGFVIPPVPVVFVQAKNETEARRRVLQDVGQYGRIERQGLYEFMHEAEISIQELTDSFRLPEIDPIKFGDEFFNNTEEKDDDEAPPVPAKPVTKRGDLWVMGDHRLLCGDSTSEEDVGRLMNGAKAALMNTDPPYGINYVNSTSSASANAGHAEIENDDLLDEELEKFLTAAFKTAAGVALRQEAAWYLWHAHLTQGYFAAAAAAAANVMLHRQIIWAKPSLIFGRGQYHWIHEPCFMGWIKGNMPPFYGERNQTTVWNLGRENDKIHPTQKPVALFEIPIRNHMKRGEICYEPFAGSGSQFIAAERLERRCFGLEISPGYCDSIVQRWSTATGKKAALEKAKGSKKV
jgi:DNA modification methylase